MPLIFTKNYYPGKVEVLLYPNSEGVVNKSIVPQKFDSYHEAEKFFNRSFFGVFLERQLGHRPTLLVDKQDNVVGRLEKMFGLSP